MNVFGKCERNWRKARKRGVSPIIATILLVAITVVLAAVLYVLISGLTHGAGSAPLGTNFGWGTPINDTGVKALGCGTTAGAYCYGVELNVGGSLSVTNIVLSLKNPTGSTVAWPTAVASTSGTAACAGGATPTAACISLVTPTSTTPVAYYGTSTSGWFTVSPFSGVIPSGSSIVIYFNTAAGAGLLGDQIVAVGASGYSGTVASSVFS